MSDSYEIQKRECPEGFHSHPNNTRCHPINQPHRPGSKAEKEHFALGLDNSWYEQHGTTREEYEKERAGEESKEKTPEEKLKTPEKEPEERPEGESVKDPEEEGPTEEESQPDPDRPLRTKVQWQGIKNFRKGNEEQFKRVEQAREYFEKIKNDDTKSGHEKFDEVLSIATGKTRSNGFISDYDRKYIDNAPREVQDSLLHSILDAMDLNPLLSATFDRGLDFGSMDGGAMMYYTPGINRITVGYQELRNIYNIDDEVDHIKDPITKEESDWGFHFTGSTNMNAVCHECGHGVSSMCNSLQYISRPDGDDTRHCKSLIKDAGIKGIWCEIVSKDDSNRFDERMVLEVDTFGTEDTWEEDLQKAKTILEQEGYILVEGEPTKDEYSGEVYPSYEIKLSPSQRKNKIDKAYEMWKTPKDLDRLKEKYGEDSPFYKISAEREKNKDRSYEGFLTEQATEFGSGLTTGHLGMERIRECEAVYKKLYGLKKIAPSDVYSEYGYYGESVWMRTNDQAKQRKLNYLVADERFAEAYSDVVVRGDKANSMSKLLVAHSYYELAQLQDGYEGSFEDYIKEFMGDSLKERIIKMISDNHNDFIKSNPYSKTGYAFVKELGKDQGLFIHKGKYTILKRCKRGYWKHPETGECVPKEMLLNQPKKPREKREDEPSQPKTPKKEPEEKPKKPRESSTMKVYRQTAQLYAVHPNPVHELKENLTDEEIIDKIANVDDKWGCCASVSLAYIGNKFGLDVTDFRSFKSRNLFCDNDRIHWMVKLFGGKVLKSYSTEKGFKRVFDKYIEDGKEYYFGVAEHVAIIRRHEGEMQYLELQGYDGNANGWHKLDKKSLHDRFGCRFPWVEEKVFDSYSESAKRGYMEDIDLFEITNVKDNEDFKTLLAYLNSRGEQNE